MIISTLAPYLPWTDRAGRVDALRAALFAALLLPALWLLWLWATNDLGARPINGSMRFVGTWTVRILLATMTITPLVRITGWTRLIGLRRMLGVASFCYIALHLTLYVVEQGGDVAKVASEIATKRYLTIGFVALTAMAILAATSFDRAIGRLGSDGWRRLHLLVHPIAVLALLHFFMQAKLEIFEPALMAGLFVFGWLIRFTSRPPLPTLVLLAGLSALATTVIEALWYGLATRVDGWEIWRGNIEFDTDLIRPSWCVMVLALAVSALALLRRPPTRRRG